MTNAKPTLSAAMQTVDRFRQEADLKPRVPGSINSFLNGPDVESKPSIASEPLDDEAFLLLAEAAASEFEDLIAEGRYDDWWSPCPANPSHWRPQFLGPFKEELEVRRLHGLEVDSALERFYQDSAQRPSSG